MKSKYIIFILIFINTTLYAQRTYKISFDKSSYAFEQKDGVLSIIPVENDHFMFEDDLLPALPYKSYNILQPEGHELLDFKVETKTEILFKDISLFSNPIPYPTSISNSLNESGFKQCVSKKSSANPVIFAADNILKGYYFTTFNISPFIYDATLKELKFISEISIHIDNKTVFKSYERKNRRTENQEEIMRMVINPEEISSFYSNAIKTKTNLLDIEYLIVTKSTLIEQFQPMVRWKIQKGIRTEIITTEEIYANYNEPTNQLKIKRCLADYYQNRGLKWVLLGGDDTVVPVQGCYSIVNNSTVDYNIPTDLFYACFDNAFDWNANGNDVIGEVNDNIDMYPEIYISRLPVRTQNEVKSFVNKLLVYEKNPPRVNYVNKMLLTGTQLWSTWNDMSDAHQRSERMYNEYIAPYWNGEKYFFYDTGTSMTGDATYNLTAGNLQVQIDEGYHFLHMATHGGAQTWGMESGSSYRSDNASVQQNNNASIIVTMACTTNAFDNATDPCLSEAFIRNPDGACIAYFGGSRSGWGWVGNTTSLGPSFQYDAHFFKKLFSEESILHKFKFGAVTTAAKQQMVGSSNYNDSYRWIQFSQNAIGDPEMEIFTANPQTFLNPVINTNGTNITVSTGGINNCTIALTSMDYGKTYFKVAEDVSSYTFTDVAGPYCITITKHNYIPYVYPEDVYIQNEILDSDYYIQGRNIYVGRNVTTSKPQGNVIITNNAHITFEATGNVLFEGGFECTQGSSFDIIK